MFAKYLTYSFFLLCVIVLIPSAKSVADCNVHVCGSVVSKCLILQSCECTLADCHCCKDCFTCLGDLYAECCGCLDMCPKNNVTSNTQDVTSQVGDFEGVPEIFEALTADEDSQWTTLTFPKHNSIKHHFDKGTHGFIEELYQQVFSQNTVNCTVVFLNTCTTSDKCMENCESMGASKYRWFHDGCCECVGSNCYKYGLNENYCSACPADDLENQLTDDDDIEYEQFFD